MEIQRIMLVTTVPSSHLYEVLDAMGDAGAGQIGDYTHCAYFSAGTGRFLPTEAAHPALGERLERNEVEEYRIETFCRRDQVREVTAAIRSAHPYEEPVIHLLPLLDEGDF